MALKELTAEEFRHGTLEETLGPGESLIIKHQSGKVFELRRIDNEMEAFLNSLDDIFREIPSDPAVDRVDMAKIVIEDRD